MTEWEQIARRDTNNSTFALLIFKHVEENRYIFELSVDGSLMAEGDLSESQAKGWVDK